MIQELQKQLLAEGKTGPEYHYWSRPPRVEAEGVHHLMTFAEMLGAHVYIVHLSCEEALAEAMHGSARGVQVWVETLIQYLLCDKTDAERADFEGAKFVMSPPLREKHNQAVLWNGLKKGFVATLATDAVPRLISPRRSRWGAGDFTKIPNGMSTVALEGPHQFILYARGQTRPD